MTGLNMSGNVNIKHPDPNNSFSKVIGDIFDNVLTQGSMLQMNQFPKRLLLLMWSHKFTCLPLLLSPLIPMEAIYVHHFFYTCLGGKLIPPFLGWKGGVPFTLSFQLPTG